jgi:hypothetical protein
VPIHFAFWILDFGFWIAAILRATAWQRRWVR